MSKGKKGSDRLNRNGVANVRETEIAPGYTVPNDWDTALVERWSDRKARRMAERERA